MVWTFKLVNGGIAFNADGKISMVGVPNQISYEEVFQRTSIRFRTQKRSNALHIFEGFDKELITESNQYNSVDENSVKLEDFIILAIRDAMLQDPDIQPDSIKIRFLGTIDRTYSVEVLYQIKGNALETMSLRGTIPGV